MSYKQEKTFPSVNATNISTIDIPRLLAGKRLLRSEIPLPDEIIDSLISDNLLTEIPSIIQTSFSIQCQRCTNKDASLFGKIPCEICGQSHPYCRQCIQMGRMMTCQKFYEWQGPEPVWEKNKDPLTWNGSLSELQQEAAEIATFAIRAQQKELLLWAVCGAGKTEMLFPAIAEALTLGKRVCLASPRTDVIRELLPRFEKAFATTRIAGLYGGSEDKAADCQLILATTHQLFRFRDAFDVLVIDEVDAFPYHKDLLLQTAAASVLKENGTILYLTATPRKQALTAIKQRKLPHHFIPRRFHGHPLPVPSFMHCFSLEKSLQKCKLPNRFLKWLQQRNTCRRQLLIFVPTIKLAKNIQSVLTTWLLEQQFINAENEIAAVHAEDPLRAEKVIAFRDKTMGYLLTTTILERGVTIPSIDVAVLDAGHEVFDAAALIQIAGRAGRSANDPEGNIVFFHNGRTDAMMQAVQSIKEMNQRAGFLR